MIKRPGLIEWALGNTSSLLLLIGALIVTVRGWLIVGDTDFYVPLFLLVLVAWGLRCQQQISDYLVFKQRQREIDERAGFKNPNLTLFEGYLEGVGAQLLSLLVGMGAVSLYLLAYGRQAFPFMATWSDRDIGSFVFSLFAGFGLLLALKGLASRKNASAKQIGAVRAFMASALLVLMGAVVLADKGGAQGMALVKNPAAWFIAWGALAGAILMAQQVASLIGRAFRGAATRKGSGGLRGVLLGPDGRPAVPTAVQAGQARPQGGYDRARDFDGMPEHVRRMMQQEAEQAREDQRGRPSNGA
jgi:hypothetical protein